MFAEITFFIKSFCTFSFICFLSYCLHYGGKYETKYGDLYLPYCNETVIVTYGDRQPFCGEFHKHTF
jgi:hypothetical protein